MADIVALKTGYNEQVVTALEALLEEAKRGEITSIMVISEMRGGFVGTSWTGTDDLYKLAGAAARMQHVIQKRIDKGVTQ